MKIIRGIIRGIIPNLIRTAFLISFCAVSARADTNYYLTMRRSLADIESTNNVAARNRHSTASGKYQFLKSWDAWFKRRAGYTWSSTVPAAKAPKSVKELSSIRQDRLFDIYFNEVVSPWIIDVNSRYVAAQKLSRAELLALAHRQGTGGATKYLKSGIDPYSGKYGNKHVSVHMRRMREQMKFYGYLDSQRQLVKGA